MNILNTLTISVKVQIIYIYIYIISAPDKGQTTDNFQTN